VHICFPNVPGFPQEEEAHTVSGSKLEPKHLQPRVKVSNVHRSVRGRGESNPPPLIFIQYSDNCRGISEVEIDRKRRAGERAERIQGAQISRKGKRGPLQRSGKTKI